MVFCGYYCIIVNLIQLYIFVGLNYGNWTEMHPIENVPVPSGLYETEYCFKLPPPKQLAHRYYLYCNMHTKILPTAFSDPIANKSKRILYN